VTNHKIQQPINIAPSIPPDKLEKKVMSIILIKIITATGLDLLIT